MNKTSSPELKEAIFVAECATRAAKHGLLAEWFTHFIADIKNGTRPTQAARDACYEWDI